MQRMRWTNVLVFALIAGGVFGAALCSAQDAGVTQEPFSIQAVKEDIKRQWNAGGMTMWYILFLSILGMAFILERIFRLRRRAVCPSGFAAKADELWKAGNMAELEALCEKHKKSTLAKIVGFICKHKNLPSADIANIAGDIASRDVGHHYMLAYPLAAIGSLAPLLGLFGTVIGMIESFETVAIAGTMGDPSLLASGISKALVTTAWGLIVAIPTLFFYNVFRFRTQYLASMLDEEANGLINEWLVGKETRK